MAELLATLRPSCESCRHWLRPGFPDMRSGDCTLHPTWIITEPEHFCGQYAPTVAAVNPDAVRKA